MIHSFYILFSRQAVEETDSDPGSPGWWKAVSIPDGAVETLSGETMLQLEIQRLVWVQVRGQSASTLFWSVCLGANNVWVASPQNKYIIIYKHDLTLLLCISAFSCFREQGVEKVFASGTYRALSLMARVSRTAVWWMMSSAEIWRCQWTGTQTLFCKKPVLYPVQVCHLHTIQQSHSNDSMHIL